MSGPALVSRRAFLLGATAAIVGAAGACSSGNGDDEESKGRTEEPATTEPDSDKVAPSAHADATLLALFDDPGAVAALGRAVASVNGAPSLDDASTRLVPLGLETNTAGKYAVRDAAAFAAAIDVRAAADYAEQDVVVVDGFILSATHAAVAVLLA